MLKTSPIIIKVIKRRFSNGEPDNNNNSLEFTEPIIWFSVPITINKAAEQLIRHFFSETVSVDDMPYKDRKKIYDFEPNWTERMVNGLKNAYPNNDYIFMAYNHNISDRSFTSAFCISIKSLQKDRIVFQGKAPTDDSTTRFVKSYSPLDMYSFGVEGTKHGIELLLSVGGEVPVEWIQFLIEQSPDDLSEFLRTHNISTKQKGLRICRGNGELYNSLYNVNEGAVSDYKFSRPTISYRAALEAVKVYEKYGADPLYYRDNSNLDYEDYSQYDLEMMYRDAFEDDPSAEWNID